MDAKRWRVVYSSYHPVTGELLNSGVEFIEAPHAVDAAKAVARDGDAAKSLTARVVTSVTLDVRDPLPAAITKFLEEG